MAAIIPELREYASTDGQWWLAVVTLQPREMNHNGKPCARWDVFDNALKGKRGGWLYGWSGIYRGFDSAKKAIERMAGRKVKLVRG